MNSSSSSLWVTTHGLVILEFLVLLVTRLPEIWEVVGISSDQDAPHQEIWGIWNSSIPHQLILLHCAMFLLFLDHALCLWHLESWEVLDQHIFTLNWHVTSSRWKVGATSTLCVPAATGLSSYGSSFGGLDVNRRERAWNMRFVTVGWFACHGQLAFQIPCCSAFSSPSASKSSLSSAIEAELSTTWCLLAKLSCRIMSLFVVTDSKVTSTSSS